MGKSIILQNLKTIAKHKWYVFQECRACGITWQGITHDLSKFSPSEFMLYARYFYGDKSPIEAEKAKKGFSEAWLHHKGCNKHHWEWWTDFGPDGEVVAYKIPLKYVIEMVCDWVGAGKAYEKEEWDPGEPIRYYYKVRAGRHFHPATEELIIELLKTMRDCGMDEFHYLARLYLSRGDVY